MANYQLPTDKDYADKAYALVISDLSVYDSIPELANKVGTNAVTLKRAFKKHYGVNLFQFSRAFRIEKAKALLVDTDYTLQTISTMLGYSEGHNFQVAFRTVVGCNPGAWRKGTRNQ